MATQDHDSKELGRQTVASGLTALVTRIAHSAILLGASLVLARLLTPADFGVFAMAVPLAVLGTEFANHGFQIAILQRPDAALGDIDALFRFALRVNLLVAGAMVGAGWGLSHLFDEPRLVPLVIVWAALVYLLTFTGFQEALLKRDMRFPAVLTVQLVSVGVSVIVAIGSALGGAGHWALLIQVISMEGTRAVGIHWLSRWRPGRFPRSDPASVSAMQRSWRALAGLRLANWVNDQPDLIAIGRIGGAPVLGLYDTARRWSRYAFSEPFFAVSEVAVATLSRLRLHPERFADYLTKGLQAILTISLPAIALVGVEAASVVKVLLGSQWNDAVPFFRVLAVATFALAIAQSTEWICLAQGRVTRLLRWSFAIRMPALVGAVIVGARRGPLAVAIALASAEVALALPTIWYNVHGSPIAATRVFRAAARPVIASVLAAAAVASLRGVLPDSPGALRLAIATTIHTGIVAMVWLAVPGGLAAGREMIAAIRDLRSS